MRGIKALLQIGFREEPLLVDDEAFMGPFTDKTRLIIGGHLEDKPPAVNLDEFAFAPDLHPDGGRFRMGDVHMRSHGVLAGFEAGENALQAGLLHEPDHRDGRKDGNIPAAEALGAVLPGGDGLQTVLDSSFNHNDSGVSISLGTGSFCLRTASI